LPLPFWFVQFFALAKRIEPLSATYPEFVRLSLEDNKEVTSEEQLGKWTDERFKEGKALIGHKEKLIAFEPVSCSIPRAWTKSFYVASQDYGTKAKQNEEYLEIRSIVIAFYIGSSPVTRDQSLKFFILSGGGKMNYGPKQKCCCGWKNL
jgi:hypothetical protein